MISMIRMDEVYTTDTPLLKHPPAPGLSSPDYLQAVSQAELGGNSVPSGTGAVKPGLLYISGAWAVKKRDDSQARAAESGGNSSPPSGPETPSGLLYISGAWAVKTLDLLPHRWGVT